jgi:hAT family C-terminal dimerisation region
MYLSMTVDTYKVSVGADDCLELAWWRSASVRLPLMGRLVRWSWSVQSSSSASERAFSKAGYINNKRRASLTGASLWECSILAQPVPD